MQHAIDPKIDCVFKALPDWMSTQEPGTLCVPLRKHHNLNKGTQSVPYRNF